jgi:para-nitrobenzyl esterase
MINYRLGMFSALALPELSRESSLDTSGNFALLDQQAALGWLQTSLDAFGGDPDNVTVAGSSAGGESVCMHLASPRSAGLFHQAIIHSGAFDTTLSGNPACATRSAEASDATALEFLTALGCDGDDRLACLRAIDTRQLVEADAGRTVGFYVDGIALPEHASDAIAAGRWNRVPVMIGTSHDEARGVVAVIPGVDYPLDPAVFELIVSALTGGTGTEELLARYPLDEYEDPAFALAALATDAAFACPSLDLQRSMAQYVDVYAWEFNDPDAPPADFDGFPSGASHASEVPYLFPRTPAVGELTESQEALAEEMIRLWASFAADGSPQTDASPHWPAWQPDDPRTMSLEQGANRLIDDFAEDHRCDD